MVTVNVYTPYWYHLSKHETLTQCLHVVNIESISGQPLVIAGIAGVAKAESRTAMLSIDRLTYPW